MQRYTSQTWTRMRYCWSTNRAANAGGISWAKSAGSSCRQVKQAPVHSAPTRNLWIQRESPRGSTDGSIRIRSMGAGTIVGIGSLNGSMGDWLKWLLLRISQNEKTLKWLYKRQKTICRRYRITCWIWFLLPIWKGDINLTVLLTRSWGM